MSRLDQHVGLVQSKLTIERFFWSLGVAIAVFLTVVLAAFLVDRFFWVMLPHSLIWFGCGAGLAVALALVDAVVRRPTRHQAAAIIDEKLGLQEKYTTALYARSMNTAGIASTDSFVIAAMRDAERTSENVSLHRRFPLAFPRTFFAALAPAVAVFLVWAFVQRIDPFDWHKQRAEVRRQATATAAAQLETKSAVQSALAQASQVPVSAANHEKIELAKQELEQKLVQQNADPSAVKLTIKKLQEEANAAHQEEQKNIQKFAQSMADKAVFNSLNPSADDHGPVADASRDIADGNFAKAMDTLQALPEKFNDLTPEKKKEAAEQMKKVAQQLQQIASDPAAMQNLQKQLQQQGVAPQQVQQAMQLAQQAAQGNQQAQQQMQQMAKQAMQQMNGGQGPTGQQSQAIQKLMQQMQSVASAQSTAQQMQAGAQQLAQGMQMAQAAAQQGGQQQGQQSASAKSGSAQQQAQQAGAQASGSQQGSQSGSQQASAQQSGGQPGGQQGGQKGQQQGGQQANAQQPGSQPGGQQGSKSGGQQSGGQQSGGQQASAQQGGQPGGGQGSGSGQGSGGQNAQQQMKQAADQMAQALGQMDAVKKDAEQVAAAQNGAGDGGGNQPGQNPGQGGQAQGQPGPGGGGAQCGLGPGGGHGDSQQAPYAVKQEMDASKNIANGKVLARTFIKQTQESGKSVIQLSPAAKAAVKDSTDDVAEQSIPKDAQKAVKDYFDNVGSQ